MCKCKSYVEALSVNGSASFKMDNKSVTCGYRIYTRTGYAKYEFCFEKTGYLAPLIVAAAFLITCLLAFATGTSVGTYFVVIPILFPMGVLECSGYRIWQEIAKRN